MLFADSAFVFEFRPARGRYRLPAVLTEQAFWVLRARVLRAGGVNLLLGIAPEQSALVAEAVRAAVATPDMGLPPSPVRHLPRCDMAFLTGEYAGVLAEPANSTAVERLLDFLDGGYGLGQYRNVRRENSTPKRWAQRRRAQLRRRQAKEKV